MNLLRRDRPRSVLASRTRQLLIIGACAFLGASIDVTVRGAVMSDLFDGDVVDVGNVRFDNWELVSLASTAAVNPDLSQILVVPLDDDPLNPGLQFVANGQLSTVGLNSIDLVFQFRVSSMAGGVHAVGHSLELTGFNFGGDGGIVLITDELADGGGADLGSTLVIADKASEFYQLLDTSDFGPRPEVVVVANVFVTGLSESDVASLDTFAQRFSQQIPEPASLSMIMTVGTMCLLTFRRGPASRREPQG